MKEQLNDLQISKIEQFCADEEMYNAVKAVLLAGIYTHGTVQRGFTPDPLKNGAFSLVHLSTQNPVTDEVLGQHIRGVWEGINAMHNAFNNLKNIKSDTISPLQDINEAI